MNRANRRAGMRAKSVAPHHRPLLARSRALYKLLLPTLRTMAKATRELTPEDDVVFVAGERDAVQRVFPDWNGTSALAVLSAPRAQFARPHPALHDEIRAELMAPARGELGRCLLVCAQGCTVVDVMDSVKVTAPGGRA